jgi:hypothetical protein
MYTEIKTYKSNIILKIMLKSINQDDFGVLLVEGLLVEGFAFGISAGVIFETGFSPINYFTTPYFEYSIFIIIMLGSLALLLDALNHIKDNLRTKSLIYIAGVILGCFTLIPTFSIVSTLS